MVALFCNQCSVQLSDAMHSLFKCSAEVCERVWSCLSITAITVQWSWFIDANSAAPNANLATRATMAIWIMMIRLCYQLVNIRQAAVASQCPAWLTPWPQWLRPRGSTSHRTNISINSLNFVCLFLWCALVLSIASQGHAERTQSTMVHSMMTSSPRPSTVEIELILLATWIIFIISSHWTRCAVDLGTPSLKSFLWFPVFFLH